MFNQYAFGCWVLFGKLELTNAARKTMEIVLSFQEKNSVFVGDVHFEPQFLLISITSTMIKVV